MIWRIFRSFVKSIILTFSIDTPANEFIFWPGSREVYQVSRELSSENLGKTLKKSGENPYENSGGGES